MEYTPISPFMRPISRAHLQESAGAQAPCPRDPVNKWAVFRALSRAQASFGLRERDLTVLQGLLSFHPEDELVPGTRMIVFPSNRTLCERLNGMAPSTLRRHLAQLVSAGIITRRDSPNGKRYARRDGPDGAAFGFDLAPLLRRAPEIAHAADAARKADAQLKRLRETVSLMRRDVAGLAGFGARVHPGLDLWDHLRDRAELIARTLRRKLSLDDLAPLRDELITLLERARQVIDGAETEEMSTSDSQNERHYLNSNIESFDRNPAVENPVSKTPEPEQGRDRERPVPRIPLHLVTTSCPSLASLYQGAIRHWHQLYDAANQVRTALGIDASVWEDAKRHMGPEQASVVVAAILERFAEIRSPGGYLRTLTAKAAAGQFSCGPMVLALHERHRNGAGSQL